MAEYLIQGDSLDAIVEAINQKAGTQAAMTPAEMATAINNIVVGEGLPTPVYRLKTGEFTLTANESSHVVTHNLGAAPQLFFLWCRYFNRDLKDTNPSKTMMFVMAQVMSLSNKSNWLCVAKTTTSAGNIQEYLVPAETLTDSDVSALSVRVRTNTTFQAEITRSGASESAQWRWLAINISS